MPVVAGSFAGSSRPDAFCSFWCPSVLRQISCATNTPIEILGGASLEITSAESSTKINNVEIWVREGSFLCTVPELDWTSVETVVVS